MAHIPYVPEDEADGVLGRLYDRYREAHGGVDNILRIHSLNPRSLEDHARLYGHLMRGPSPLRGWVGVAKPAVRGARVCMRPPPLLFGSIPAAL